MNHLCKLISKLDKFSKHSDSCNSLIRERDDSGRFTRYACNCGLSSAKRDIENYLAQQEDFAKELELELRTMGEQ